METIFINLWKSWGLDPSFSLKFHPLCSFFQTFLFPLSKHPLPSSFGRLPPCTCPLNNPFDSCTHLGHTSLQFQDLFWWFCVGRSGDIYNPKAHGKAQPGHESLESALPLYRSLLFYCQPWLPFKQLQQLTCSKLKSHLTQEECTYHRQHPQIPCHIQ